MGVTSLSLVFSECVVLCVTCRPLMCGLQPPGATPATHPSGMQSPCSPPAGRSSHTQGSGQGQALPGLDILGGGRVHTASQHSSTQLPSTALGSGLPSHLPHRAPLPPPKDSSGACDVSWGGAHLPRFPSAVCLIKKKKKTTFYLLSFVNARVSVTAPTTSTSAQEAGVHTRRLSLEGCPGLGWRSQEPSAGTCWSSVAASGGDSDLPPASAVLTQPAAVHS